MARRSVPTWAFIPKRHSREFFLPCFISGSRDFSAFFVDGGASMIVAFTIVPLLSSSRFCSSRLLTSAKIASVSRCFSGALLALIVTR